MKFYTKPSLAECVFSIIVRELVVLVASLLVTLVASLVSGHLEVPWEIIGFMFLIPLVAEITEYFMLLICVYIADKFDSTSFIL